MTTFRQYADGLNALHRLGRKRPQFTATEKCAVNLMRKWGKLERYGRGQWGQPGLNAKYPAQYVGTPTIKKLYNRFLVDILCVNGSWQWDGRSEPRFAIPTHELIRAVSGSPAPYRWGP